MANIIGLPHMLDLPVIYADYDKDDLIVASLATGKFTIIPPGHRFHGHANHKAAFKEPYLLHRFIRGRAGQEWLYKMEFTAKDEPQNQHRNNIECRFMKCSEPFLVTRYHDGSFETHTLSEAVQGTMLPPGWDWSVGSVPKPTEADPQTQSFEDPPSHAERAQPEEPSAVDDEASCDDCSCDDTDSEDAGCSEEANFSEDADCEAESCDEEESDWEDDAAQHQTRLPQARHTRPMLSSRGRSRRPLTIVAEEPGE